MPLSPFCSSSPLNLHEHPSCWGHEFCRHINVTHWRTSSGNSLKHDAQRPQWGQPRMGHDPLPSAYQFGTGAVLAQLSAFRPNTVPSGWLCRANTQQKAQFSLQAYTICFTLVKKNNTSENWSEVTSLAHLLVSVSDHSNSWTQSRVHRSSYVSNEVKSLRWLVSLESSGTSTEQFISPSQIAVLGRTHALCAILSPSTASLNSSFSLSIYQTWYDSPPSCPTTTQKLLNTAWSPSILSLHPSLFCPVPHLPFCTRVCKGRGLVLISTWWPSGAASYSSFSYMALKVFPVDRRSNSSSWPSQYLFSRK